MKAKRRVMKKQVPELDVLLGLSPDAFVNGNYAFLDAEIMPPPILCDYAGIMLGDGGYALFMRRAAVSVAL
jgi:hypothetical protein